MTDLASELAAVRTRIHHLHVDMTRPTYKGGPWEHRHNTEAALQAAHHQEAELLDRLDAEEQRTADLVAAATASGNSLLYAIAYVATSTRPALTA